MDCVKCGKKAEVKVQNLTTCNSCFLKIIEKRVRKELRLNRLIKKKDRLLVIDDDSAESKVSLFLLKSIINNLQVKIKTVKIKYELGKELNGKYNKVILPWNADKEDEYFLQQLFQAKPHKYLGHYILKKTRYIKLLLPVLESEVEIFARIKKFKFTIKKKRNSVSKMLDKLEEEYPEVKFSLLQSIKELK